MPSSIPLSFLRLLCGRVILTGFQTRISSHLLLPLLPTWRESGRWSSLRKRFHWVGLGHWQMRMETRRTEEENRSQFMNLITNSWSVYSSSFFRRILNQDLWWEEGGWRREYYNNVTIFLRAHLFQGRANKRDRQMWGDGFWCWIRGSTWEGGNGHKLRPTYATLREKTKKSERNGWNLRVLRYKMAWLTISL